MSVDELEKNLDADLSEFAKWTDCKERELQINANDDVCSAFHDMRDAVQGLIQDFKRDIIKYLSENQT